MSVAPTNILKLIICVDITFGLYKILGSVVNF